MFILRLAFRGFDSDASGQKAMLMSAGYNRFINIA